MIQIKIIKINKKKKVTYMNILIQLVLIILTKLINPKYFKLNLKLLIANLI